MQAKDNKMEHIGKIVAYLILAINAFFVGTLILSAYSPYLNPKLNPLSSGLGLAFPLFLILSYQQDTEQPPSSLFFLLVMYIEKYIEKPRHIEFQILADKYGNTIHLGERDCSIQRNHQKLVEESPSPALNDELRKRMGDTAVAVAKAVNYENAGTVEFLLDKNDNYYFMEVNTRIQVEHGITELVTGVDLIKEQIKIAAGESLGIKQEDVRIHGAAMEIRINAENPEKNFAPNPGTIKNIHIPGGNGVRIDTAVYSGYTIPPFYDSMIMKVMTYANDRKTVIEKMRSVLGEIIIEGVTTNTDFMYDICQNEKFIKGDVSTDFIPEEYPQVCKK